MWRQYLGIIGICGEGEDIASIVLNMEAYYHLFSDGKLSVDLHQSEQDFVDAINRVAIVAYLSKIIVLAFSIEDTHLHLLLKGEPESIIEFRDVFQCRTRRNGNPVFKLEYLKIEDEEHLMNVAIYVICQATKDGKRTMPYDYKWSSASLYFRTGINNLLWILDKNGNKEKVCMTDTLSVRQQRKLFKSIHIPKVRWEICRGLILPSSFVSVVEFESIFKTHNAFRVFMGSGKRQDKIILDDIANVRGICLEENESREIVHQLSKELFDTSNIKKLDVNQRIMLARKFREKYRVGYSQLSRRVHLPEEEIRRNVR